MFNFRKLIKYRPFRKSRDTLYLGTVIAINSTDPKSATNVWVKDVCILDPFDDPILSFGSPCQFYLGALGEWIRDCTSLCIDACGRNHGTQDSVHITRDDLKDIYEALPNFLKEKVK